MEIRVRTAPSPTGIPHIGNTWSALFNFLFARKNKGKFILRLEDTDRERLVPESVAKIYETLHWLGLDYDEGPDIGGSFAPYIQSERKEIYRQYADELVKKGIAYEDNGAIRFKTNKEGKTGWVDLAGNKTIEFDNSTQEDFVILKSDGFPTYHLANVVDDHLMKISHVIRGGEWISSVPKHIMLYQAFGWELPQFVHLPLLLGVDKSKLSKRHGAKSVLEFRQEGYLREALLNFMALLGWSPPSGREILTLEEMINEFDLKDINLASPVFDVKKLEWLNGEWIRKLTIENLQLRIWEYLDKKYPQELIEKTIPLVRERIKKLSDYMNLAGFFFEEPKIEKGQFGNLALGHLKEALKVMEESEWQLDKLQDFLLKIVEKNKFKTGDFFMSLRLALTGQRVTPPIVESMVILGKEKTLARINRAVNL
ncbi:glutamate--tRNA ligase [Candidatus Microgenomates bacterium]|nr:glutamate--tRNA ligase [Candidatus Microgenomates bacterium]